MKSSLSFFFNFIFIILFLPFASSQHTMIEGYVYESKTRGYINLVELSAIDGSLYEELTNGKHAYYIGVFTEAAEASNYMLINKVKLKCPKVRLVQFMDGQRQA